MKVGWKIAIGVVVLWALNPDLEQHRPVAMKNIRDALPGIIDAEMRDNPWIPSWVVDMSGKFIDNRADYYTSQLANQLEHDSYVIFSVTRLQNPELYLSELSWSPKTIEVDKITSFGILGMVW